VLCQWGGLIFLTKYPVFFHRITAIGNALETAVINRDVSKLQAISGPSVFPGRRTAFKFMVLTLNPSADFYTSVMPAKAGIQYHCLDESMAESVTLTG